MSILDYMYMNYDDEDDEADKQEFLDKIKALKQILLDPPSAFYNYDLVQDIIIQWEEKKFLSDKQKKILEDAYEEHFEGI